MKKLLIKTAIVIGIIILIILIDGFLIEPDRLKTNEIKIVNNNITNNWNGLKIIHISDIYYANNSVLLSKVKEEVDLINPDIIIITGDIITGETNESSLIDYLNSLKASLGKYIIQGDNDLTDNWKSIIEKTDFIDINDNSKLIFKEGLTPIMLTGISSMDIYEKLDEKWNKALEQIDKATATCFKILAIHEPDYVDKIDTSSYNLILSGHSKGGVLGKFAIPDTATKYTIGKYNLGDTELYVSNGLADGFRFMNTPSINFYRIIK